MAEPLPYASSFVAVGHSHPCLAQISVPSEELSNIELILCFKDSEKVLAHITDGFSFPQHWSQVQVAMALLM